MTTDRPIRRFQNVTNDSEAYTLIWFSKNVNANDENIKIQKKPRQIINRFKVFDDLDECVNYLTDLINQKVVLIVSEPSEHLVIPVVNDFPQLSAVYIYSPDVTTTEEWTPENKKVKSIFLFCLIKYV